MNGIAKAWWGDDEADFWLSVETCFVDLNLGSSTGAVALLRGESGERVLRGLQRTRIHDADDPQALARAAIAFSVT